MNVSVRLALVASGVAMFAMALLLVELGWSFWERQGPIWVVGVLVAAAVYRRAERAGRE